MYLPNIIIAYRNFSYICENRTINFTCPQKNKNMLYTVIKVGKNTLKIESETLKITLEIIFFLLIIK